MQSNVTRIVLADDHGMMRAGLAALIKSMPGFDVVGEAENGLELLEVIAEAEPDIAILDISMPSMSGTDAAARIRRDYPKVRTIALSMHRTEDWVLRALRAGVQAYVTKDAAAVELKEALRAVKEGDMFLSSKISRQVISRLLSEGEAGSKYDQLSDRQREILTLIADGKTNNQIAEILHLSPKTVEWHRAQIMERLGMKSLAELIRYVVRIGVVDP
ncbi:MAG: response regulator transcription factor [Rhodothermales bacterium]|nr:response regulator transcription factor [Rhodothermales bacterium]MBO6780191.1 response regulator transcription factor [Rhodothermales bacterium]